MIGRIDVKSHNIAQFLGKLLVIGELELAHPMRLKTMLAPNTLHRGDTDADDLGHGDRRPVGCFARWRLQRCRHNIGCDLITEARQTSRTGLLTKQPVHAFAHKPFLPPPNARFAGSGLASDLVGSDAVRRQKNDASSPNVLLRPVPVCTDRFKQSPICGVQSKADPCAHHTDSHNARARGIHKGIHSSDFAH